MSSQLRRAPPAPPGLHPELGVLDKRRQHRSSALCSYPPGHAPCSWWNDEETPRHRGIKIEEKSYISVVRRKARTRRTRGHREVAMVEAMGPGPALRPH